MFVLFAVPLNEAPELVTSPVAMPINLLVCNEVAVPAFPVTLVWSPVFEPANDELPTTVMLGVELPESVTPFTEVGVIAPSVKEMAGVVVDVATVPETPFAVVTETEVTVPEFVPEGTAKVPSALKKPVVPPLLAGTKPFAEGVNTSNIAVA